MHFKEAKGILSAHNGMNIYRGCTHGCIYCDSRSRCYHIDHLFEDVEVKSNAVALLEDSLKRKRKKCMIGTGAMTDPYLHLEKTLQNTRKCLEVIGKYGFGICLQTKSDMILRDLDLLKDINKKAKCVVQVTLTTYDEELCRILEPGVCTTAVRFEVLKTMRDNDIPTVVWMTPILPYINDTEHNIMGLIGYCVQAGVHGIINYGMGLTLREGNREYFYHNLDIHFPGLKERYIKEYGNSYSVISKNNGILMKIFNETCRENGIIYDNEKIFAYMREFKEKSEIEQLTVI